ncbi:hypothetical protein [Nostoc sp.]
MTIQLSSTIVLLSKFAGEVGGRSDRFCRDKLSDRFLKLIDNNQYGDLD